MLDRQKGDIIFECDGCGATLGSETGNFELGAEPAAPRTLARSEGWRRVAALLPSVQPTGLTPQGQISDDSCAPTRGAEIRAPGLATGTS